MSWLIVSISAYLILAVVFLVDRYLLTGPIPSPKVYAFFVGTLGILVLILIPFVNFAIPGIDQVILSLLAGIFFIYALSWFFKALSLFESSRIVPAIGGFLPFFTFLLVYLFSGGKETLNLWGFLAFLLLVFGSVLMTYEKTKKVSLESLKISLITAFFLALSFVLAKYVYLGQPFWSGYIWIRIGSALMAIAFLFTSEVRNGLFKAKANFKKKTAVILFFNQAAGAGSNILQNWAFALAPIAYLAVINALQGIQYVFLLIFVVLLSSIWPIWAKKTGLKEEISKQVIFQKLFAVLLIAAGLAILAFL